MAKGKKKKAVAAEIMYWIWRSDLDKWANKPAYERGDPPMFPVEAVDLLPDPWETICARVGRGEENWANRFQDYWENWPA